MSYVRLFGSTTGAIIVGLLASSLRFGVFLYRGERFEHIVIWIMSSYLFGSEVPIAIRMAAEALILEQPVLAQPHEGVSFLVAHRSHICFAAIALMLVMGFHFYHAFK